MFTRATGWILLAALGAGLGVLAARRYHAGPVAPPPLPAHPATTAVSLFGQPRALPAFRLDSAAGPLTDADLRGHWTLVFLGFTHCPDVCPTTLQQLAGAQKAWESLPAATRPQLWFVSVDPARDTPQALADYARFFHPATRAATAAEPALHDFAQALGLVYLQVPTPDGKDYTMEHSATLAVIDPQGREAGLVRPPLDAKAIAADLAALSRSATR